jgi:hypothetical protein
MSTIQAYSDATRPAASASNVGLTIFNTTTKDINVSDGSGWRVYEDDGTTDNTLSLEFDGGDRLDTTYSMTSVQNFTVMFWMQSTDTTNSIVVVGDQGSSSYGNLSLFRATGFSGYYIVFNDTSGNFNLKNGLGNFNALCDGDWHHVAVVFDSSGTYTNVKIYEDGSETVDEDVNTTNGWTRNNKVAGTSATNFQFGARSVSTPSYFTGKLDQMAFFESVLSGPDISNIWNSGSGGDLLTLGFSPDAYYRVGYYSDDTNSNGSVASAGQDIGTVADYSGNGHNASQASTSLKPNYVADPAF